MYCQYCGKELNENEVCGCPGAAQANAQPQQDAQQQQNAQQQQEAQQYQQNAQQHQQEAQPQQEAQQQQNAQQYAPPQNAGSVQQGGAMNGLALGGFIMGIIGVVFSFMPFVWFLSFIFSLLAVILSGSALSQIGKNGGTGKGFAVTGLILGIIVLAISLISVIVLATCIGMAASCFSMF